MEGSQEETYAGVPDNVRSLIDHVGVLGELHDEDAEQMYSKFREGLCMTCGAQLSEGTLLLINKHGIVAGYCGGPCMQDLAVLGYLQESHDDIVDRVSFRGGAGDEAEDEIDGTAEEG